MMSPAASPLEGIKGQGVRDSMSGEQWDVAWSMRKGKEVVNMCTGQYRQTIWEMANKFCVLLLAVTE